jgi:hypothetical protein
MSVLSMTHLFAKSVVSCGLLLAALLSSTAAIAAPIRTLVDITGPTNSDSIFSQRSFTGQSFTMFDTGLLSGIGLQMVNMNRSSVEQRNDRYLTLQLLSGNGLGGALMGQSTVNVDEVLTDSGTFRVIDFFDASQIYLQPGQYTFKFIASSMRYGIGYARQSYAGGRGYWFDPMVDGGANQDLAFRVAFADAPIDTPVPVPASLWLFALGLSILAVRLRAAGGAVPSGCLPAISSLRRPLSARVA